MRNFNFFLVDIYRKTNVERDFNYLIKTQWWSVSKINNYQLQKLRELLIYSYENVTYYKKLFDKINFDPKKIKSIKELQKIPILTKELIKENFQDLISVRSKKYGMWEKSSGGSTGNPLKYYLSYNSLSLELANRLRAFTQAGYKIGDKIIYFGGPSIFGKIDTKRKIYFKLYNFIPFNSFNINDEQLSYYIKLIKSCDARLMFSYASSAEVLAKFIIKHNIKNINFKGVFTTSEMLFEESRRIIESAFRCEVFNFYGANDGSVSAFECDEHNGLHISSERSIIEVLDNSDNSVPEGMEGNLVTTDLTNFSMPFIRYKVNDIVSLKPDLCGCGRGLPMIKKVHGRTSDFIIDKNNNKIHGEFFSHIFSKCTWIEGFQVVQKNKTSVKILLKTNYYNSNELSDIKKILKNKLMDMEIDIEFVPELEESKNGKRKFVISEISS